MLYEAFDGFIIGRVNAGCLYVPVAFRLGVGSGGCDMVSVRDRKM